MTWEASPWTPVAIGASETWENGRRSRISAKCESRIAIVRGEDKVTRIGRREFLGWMGIAPVIGFLPRSKEGGEMYGMISKISVVPGKRDVMIGILKESAADLPGCLSYVVAKDATDENAVWITEVWNSAASHDASLALPAVRKAMARGQTFISGFDKVAVTSPVWGTGLGARTR